MKRLLLMAGATAAFAIGGCGEKEESADRGGAAPDPSGVTGIDGLPLAPREDTVETLFEEMGVQLDNFARALRGVRESESPEKFSEIVGLVSLDMRSIAGRLSDLEVPPDEVKRGLHARRKEREEEMQKRFGDLEVFLSGLQPDVRSSVEETLAKFMTTMSELERLVFSKYFDVEEPIETPIPPPDPSE